jgi:hypothetical protein
MSALRSRLAIAGVVTATAIAVPAAALASGSGSPSGKPAPPQASVPSTSKPTAPQASAPATTKPAPPQASGTQGVKQAQPDQPPAPVSAFAARLGVGTSAAGRAFKQIAGLAQQNGRVDPASPAFAAIARALGVSPAQLAAAWNAVSGSFAAS